MSSVATPETVDRLYRSLAIVVGDPDVTTLGDRWNRVVGNIDPAEAVTLTRIAQYAAGERVRELTGGDITADGIRGIAVACLNRTGLPEPARLGQFLADCTTPARHILMRHSEIQRFPWILAAIGVPTDTEPVRLPFITDWFRSTAPDDADAAPDRTGTTRAVIDAITRSAPPGWTEITGTLAAAAGIARAVLRVTRPGGSVGIAAPVHMPALHRLRQIDTGAGSPWWSATIMATPDTASLTPTPAAVPPAAMNLLRPSEYRADAAVTGIAFPGWLTDFCDAGTLDGEPTIAPAVAVEMALIDLSRTGVDVDPRRVMIERIDHGYRVRGDSNGQVFTVIVDDTRRVTTPTT